LNDINQIVTVEVARRSLDVIFELHHCSKIRGTDEKLPQPASKVPFIPDRFQCSLQGLLRMQGECTLLCRGYIIAVEGEMQTKNYFDLQVKCPSLFTDLNQTFIVAQALYVRGVTFQLHYWNGRRDTGEKLLRRPSNVFIIDRFQPNLHYL
jgi:hypothetical protein